MSVHVTLITNCYYKKKRFTIYCYNQTKWSEIFSFSRPKSEDGLKTFELILMDINEKEKLKKDSWFGLANFWPSLKPRYEWRLMRREHERELEVCVCGRDCVCVCVYKCACVRVCVCVCRKKRESEQLRVEIEVLLLGKIKRTIFCELKLKQLSIWSHLY